MNCLSCRLAHFSISLIVPLLPLSAAEIDVAGELQEIRAIEKTSLEPLLSPGRQLDESFRSALVKLRDTAEADWNGVTLKAARDAIWKLDQQGPWTGELADPEVRRLTRIYRENRREINAEHSSSIWRIKMESLSSYLKLQRGLRDAGRTKDVAILEKIITQIWDGNARARLLELQIGEPFVEKFPLPQIMRNRDSVERRRNAIERAGGIDTAEGAVVAGLRHLAGTQNPDGSWGKTNRLAMTGLGLLALLGHGDGPWSAEFGATTQAALGFMVDHGLKNKGIFTSGPEPNPAPYEHAIATFALAEAVTLCASAHYEIPGLKSIVLEAGQHILKNQHKSGGWDYGYKTDGSRGGDLSITAWQLQALHACSLTGLEFDQLKPVVRKALEFVEVSQKADGAFGYTPNMGVLSPNGYATLTGAGMLVFQLNGKSTSRAVRIGRNYITKKSKFDYATADCDLYGHFYEARSMFFCGGDAWKSYHDMVFPNLIEAQSLDGSWPNPGGGQKLHAVAARFETDTHYRTCLCLLILETYYRDAPTTATPPPK